MADWRLPEAALAAAWQHGQIGRLTDDAGRIIAVIYRGRCPGGSGPDIRDALLDFGDGNLCQGDVEFHTVASGWNAHRHQRDPHYDGVILHVVLDNDLPGRVSTAAGHLVPVAVAQIAPLVSGDSYALSGASCHDRHPRPDPVELGTLLDNLGDRRLAQRAARYEAEATVKPFDQVAWEATLDGLGFSRNRAGFAALASRVSIAYLAGITGRQEFGDAVRLAEALLFGVAGLLPSERTSRAMDEWTCSDADELEDIWKLYRQDWDGWTLSAAHWIFGGVRPANYPPRRIAAAARLAACHARHGFAHALIQPISDHAEDLDETFGVHAATSYWATHADFGLLLSGATASLVGPDRARDLTINVALPLALAQGARDSDLTLEHAAWEAFRRAGRVGTSGETARLAAMLGLGRQPQTTSARRQQGLLHLSRTYCFGGSCQQCPIARLDPSGMPVHVPSG